MAFGYRIDFTSYQRINMKKLFLFVLIVLFSYNGISAQSWLNRAANRSRQNSQRIVPRTNQQTRQYQQQEYERQQRLYQQRRKTLQQNNYQQHNYNAERIESSKRVASSPPNNQVQGNDKVVTLVTSGTGNTKEEAIRNALRNAIEQTFGTFVSSNTKVLNDELIKDEIVTISSGNIQSYEELSNIKEDGLFRISVKAVVSVNKLIEFAQSKGASTELAGSLFVNNIEIKEKNRENEDIALFNLRKQLMEICKKGLFDYKIETSGPKFVNDNCIKITETISIYANSNAILFCELLSKTLENLSLSDAERQEYQQMNIRYCYINNYETNQFLSWANKRGGSNYCLRNDYIYHLKFRELFESAIKMFEIKDNLGNHHNGTSYKDIAVQYNNCIEQNTLVARFMVVEQYTREQMMSLKNIEIVPTYTIPQSYYNMAYIDENTSVKGISYASGLTAQILDQKAEFKGGRNALSTFLSRNIMYPTIATESGIEGDVIVQFDVTELGSIENIKIAKSIHPSLDKEALVVARKMQGWWNPAIKDGKPVRSHQIITVPFRLR